MIYSKGIRMGFNESIKKSKQKMKVAADQFKSAESE